MSECQHCGSAMGSMSFQEMCRNAQHNFPSIVRDADGSPIGFPVEFCINPLCDYGPGSGTKTVKSGRD